MSLAKVIRTGARIQPGIIIQENPRLQTGPIIRPGAINWHAQPTFLQLGQVLLTYMYTSLVMIEGRLGQEKFTGRQLYFFAKRVDDMSAKIDELLSGIRQGEIPPGEMLKDNGGYDLQLGLELLGQKAKGLAKDIEQIRIINRMAHDLAEQDRSLVGLSPGEIVRTIAVERHSGGILKLREGSTGLMVHWTGQKVLTSRSLLAQLRSSNVVIWREIQDVDLRLKCGRYVKGDLGKYMKYLAKIGKEIGAARKQLQRLAGKKGKLPEGSAAWRMDKRLMVVEMRLARLEGEVEARKEALKAPREGSALQGKVRPQILAPTNSGLEVDSPNGVRLRLLVRLSG
ncbi:MAG: hypothetical protein JW873_04855 [Candidatus Saganbacteria bacterium]|nr:hypothetical protein [Candidatus Saganbacteria bacterium]